RVAAVAQLRLHHPPERHAHRRLLRAFAGLLPTLTFYRRGAAYDVSVIRIAPMLKRFVRNENGATAIEYGLIVAVLCLAIIGAISQSMNAIKNNFDYSAGIMKNAIEE